MSVPIKEIWVTRSLFIQETISKSEARERLRLLGLREEEIEALIIQWQRVKIVGG